MVILLVVSAGAEGSGELLLPFRDLEGYGLFAAGTVTLQGFHGVDSPEYAGDVSVDQRARFLQLSQRKVAKPDTSSFAVRDEASDRFVAGSHRDTLFDQVFHQCCCVKESVFEPRGDPVHDDHPGAGELRELDGRKADGPGADDQHRLRRGGPAAVDGVAADGEGLHQGVLLVRQRGGAVELPGRHGEQAPQPAVAVDAERLVVLGFFDDVISQLPVGGLRPELRSAVAAKLGAGLLGGVQ